VTTGTASTATRARMATAARRATAAAQRAEPAAGRRGPIRPCGANQDPGRYARTNGSASLRTFASPGRTIGPGLQLDITRRR
jgi:hypothetical protein